MSDALDPRRHFGERGQLGHRGAAAQGPSGTLKRFQVGPHAAGGEHQGVELLYVLASFEDEEVYETRRGRHAGSDLVCKSGQVTKLGPVSGGVHRRAQLANGRVEADEDRA